MTPQRAVVDVLGGEAAPVPTVAVGSPVPPPVDVVRRESAGPSAGLLVDVVVVGRTD